MFRITEDPSSGNPMQYLAKNYRNDSVVFFDMDEVRVMAAYCDPMCVCVCACSRARVCISLYMKALLHIQWTTHAPARAHTHWVTICCHNTDHVHVKKHDRIVLVIFSPSTVQGSLMMDPLWSETCWIIFKYFIILIVSINYILCISWITMCLNTFKTFILSFFLRNNFYNNCNNIRL